MTRRKHGVIVLLTLRMKNADKAPGARDNKFSRNVKGRKKNSNFFHKTIHARTRASRFSAGISSAQLSSHGNSRDDDRSHASVKECGA